MTAHRFVVLVAMALGAMQAAALENPDALAEFARNRVKWNAANIQDYEVRLRDEACWCLFGPAYGPIRNTIKAGRIQSSIYEGEKRDGYWPGRKVRIDVQTRATVEDVFARAALLIQKAPKGTFKIEYDPNYGFPALIDFDDPEWEDEQWRLVVDGFKVAPASVGETPNTSLERARER